jgi:hypothetical protein
MKHIYRSLKFLPILIFISTFTPQFNYAQENKPKTLDFPDPMTPYDFRLSLGYSAIKMPYDIALEGATINWPLIKFNAVMGLPANFLADGEISTELLTNQFKLGGRWVYKFNNELHADVGYGLAFLYGQLKQTGYDSKISGWYSYPTIAMGYDFGDLTLTLRGTMSFINSLQSTNGGVEVEFAPARNNGFSYSITMEQRFWKNTTILLGFQMNYLQMYYPQWPLFPAIDRHYWIPEILIRFTL